MPTAALAVFVPAAKVAEPEHVAGAVLTAALAVLVPAAKVADPDAVAGAAVTAALAVFVPAAKVAEPEAVAGAAETAADAVYTGAVKVAEPEQVAGAVLTAAVAVNVPAAFVSANCFRRRRPYTSKNGIRYTCFFTDYSSSITIVPERVIASVGAVIETIHASVGRKVMRCSGGGRYW